MKTAVSLPEVLFDLGEAEARRLHISRSELYAKALSEYLDRRRAESVTERLNRVYSNQSAKLDPFLREVQLRSLDREEW
jgi:metal-responsive CopG/Arc/MetJ family transcriptional regulator